MPRQNVSLIVRGAGLAASIWVALDKAVQKRGGTDKDLHRLATPEGEDLVGRIADLVVEAGKPKVRSHVIETFIITCEGQKTSELVRLGGYDWVNDEITDVRIPIEPHASVTRRIEFIECDYDPTWQEAIGELAFHGLKRPTPEDALKFGEHPEAHRKRYRTFLHEPVFDPDGRPVVLVLNECASYRDLSLDWFDDRWPRLYVLAGVREEAL